MKKSALTILKKARNKIAKKDRWTRGSFARTKHGGRAEVQSGRAFCFCAIGAVERFGGGDFALSNAALDALGVALNMRGWEKNIADFNDNPATQQGDVVALFDEAIALVMTPKVRA